MGRINAATYGLRNLRLSRNAAGVFSGCLLKTGFYMLTTTADRHHITEFSRRQLMIELDTDQL